MKNVFYLFSEQKNAGEVRTHFPGLLLCVGRDASDMHIAKVSDFLGFKSFNPLTAATCIHTGLYPCR